MRHLLRLLAILLVAVLVHVSGGCSSSTPRPQSVGAPGPTPAPGPLDGMVG